MSFAKSNSGAHVPLVHRCKALGIIALCEGSSATPTETTTRFERLCLRAFAEDAVSESRAAELQAVSVRELGERMEQVSAWREASLGTAESRVHDVPAGWLGLGAADRSSRPDRRAKRQHQGYRSSRRPRIANSSA